MGSKHASRVNVLLRNQRLRREWSQQDLANQLGTTIVTVNRWERGIQQPSPIFCLKLCTLFEKSEEELGLADQKISSTQIISEGVGRIEAPLAGEGPAACPGFSEEHMVNCSAVPDDLDAACLFIETAIQSVLPDQGPPYLATNVCQVTPSRVPVSPRGRKRNVLLVALCIILCTGLLFSFTFMPLSSAGQRIIPTHTSHQVASAQPLSSGRLLYATQWSHDRQGWPLSPQWHWSNQDGGILMTDSLTGSIILAPYSVSTSSYAIEVSMQRLSYTSLDGNAYGIVVGMTPTQGDIFGVGIHEKPEHFFIGQLNVPVSQNQPAIAGDLMRSPVVLDTAWHIYRIEVTPAHLRFLFDQKLIGEIANNTSAQRGQTGLYTVGALIRVKKYAIFAL